MFSRLRYDSCASKAEVRDNVSIFSHTVDVNRFIHSSPCYHERGLLAGNTTSTVGQQPKPDNVSNAWAEMVAVENDLRGQTRVASSCPTFSYLPKKGKISNKTEFKPAQADIDTSNKSNLSQCQMVDYRNLVDAYKGSDTLL
jgi:hypothetical protein